MVFYQVFCLTAHYPEYKHIRSLVLKSARMVLDNGGLIRFIDYLGTRPLAQKTKTKKVTHNYADYWSMYTDTNPQTIQSLQDFLRSDPRVIKSTTLKLGWRVVDSLGHSIRPTSANGSLTRARGGGEQTINRVAYRVNNERVQRTLVQLDAKLHAGTFEGSTLQSQLLQKERANRTGSGLYRDTSPPTSTMLPTTTMPWENGVGTARGPEQSEGVLTPEQRMRMEAERLRRSAGGFLASQFGKDDY